MSDSTVINELVGAKAEEKPEMKDFFISYNKADKKWAEWIAWLLEEEGYSVVIQLWDFNAGGNFIEQMQEAVTTTRKTIAILSDNYLKAEYTHTEWTNALARDPRGEKGILVPIRVQDCKPDGLLLTIIYIDLVGLSMADARIAILGAFSERRSRKPREMPAYPGEFPDNSNTTSIILDKIPAPSPPGIREKYSPQQHMALLRKLQRLPVQRFNILVFLLKVPAGLVPSMPAEQSERIGMLLNWAESSRGCGLAEVEKMWKLLKGPVFFWWRWRYLIAFFAALLIGGLLFLLLHNKPLPTPEEFDDYFETYNKDVWHEPASGWDFSNNRLYIENAPEIGYPIADVYRHYTNFIMSFILRPGNDGGAAWALRLQDSENYYLFYLSGPSGKLPQGFYTYIVKGGQFDLEKYVDRKVQAFPLVQDKQYEIEIQVIDNEIKQTIHLPGAKILCSFKDSQKTFPYGGIGFRTVGSEKFSIDDVIVKPTNTR
ncbi:MAG TPA: toll/interleukin-1 receptor domain-containing protein [Blastocatellia bacterium]|nr:toll/interleukin-1 receptor domain-containing protein [Blastocatellia bacterium]